MKFNTEPQKKRSRFIPHVGYRVVFYSIIILIIVFAKWLRKAPQPEGQDNPPSPEKPVKADPGIDPVAIMESIFPKVELKGWSLEKGADGAQNVLVSLNFLSGAENVTFPELSLRGGEGAEEWAKGEPGEKKGDGATLPGPKLGLQAVLFRIPPGKGDFTAGKITLWNRELVKIDDTSRKKGEPTPQVTP